MRIAVISDIHANYEALIAVMQDIKKKGIKKVVCLGDLVGYGPEPERVIQYMVKNRIPCVLGNHDSALLRNEELERFNPYAKDSILLTKELISEESLAFLQNLPKKRIMDGIRFVHGCPPDNFRTYMAELSRKELLTLFQRTKERIVFVGHAHQFAVYSCDGKKIKIRSRTEGIIELNKDFKFIISVGSVGQPRDGDPRAKYAIFDDFIVEARAVPYDVQKTVDLIGKLGFPEFNASRLLSGSLDFDEIPF